MTTKKVRLTKAQKQEQEALKQIKECEESLAAQKAHALEMIALAEKMPGDNRTQIAFRRYWLGTPKATPEKDAKQQFHSWLSGCVKKDLTKY